MARIPKTALPAPIPAPDSPPEVADDIGASLYRDRAGTPRVNGLTEGAANLASVTAEARRAVEAPEG